MHKSSLLACALLLHATAFAGEISFASKLLPGSTAATWRFEELTSPVDAPETYRNIDPAAEQIKAEGPVVIELANDASEYRFTIVNASGRSRFLRPVVELTTPFANANVWKGYLDPSEAQFDPGDKILSTWFPASAAISDGKAALLAINPMDLYSRLDVWRQIGDQGQVKLLLGFPVYLEDKADFTFSFVIAATDAPCGYRDAIQAMYDLFPNAFQPHPDASPDMVSSETGYLFWKSDPEPQPGSADLIRRAFQGQGSWEWCYKPFVRGGDWAITDQYSVGFRNYSPERIAEARERTRSRLAPAERSLVAPMWYLNVRWSEWTIIQDHFPEAAVAGAVKRRCWGQDTILGVYSWGGRYGQLFIDSLKQIPVDYPAVKGIGWDSCFAHQEIPAEHAGFAETNPKSFYNGKPMVLEAVGISNLLDVAHAQRTTSGVLGNAVNFKLTTPYMIGVRTEAGLYEGNPMQRPERFRRIEAMRMRLGSPKAVAWHKHAGPDYIKWVDWEDMTPEEAVDAYRQIADDNLFLSYYWGGIPAPHMPALGIENLAKALPELVSLVKQGYQPSPGVVAEDDILVARYGKGPGARLAVINPNFEVKKTALSLPPSAWDGRAPLLAAEGDTAAVTTVTADGATATFSLPARSVTILRVVALLDLPAAPLTSSGTRLALPGKAPFYRLEIATRDAQVIKADFFRHHPGATVRLKIAEASRRFKPGQDITASINTGDFPTDVQADNQRLAFVELHQYPRYDVTSLDPATLRALRLPELAVQQQLAIVIPKEAEPATRIEADRLADWFAFYTNLTQGAPNTPIVTDTRPAEASAAIVLAVAPGSLRETQAASVTVGIDNAITIALADADAAQPAVLAFLNAMDKAYPYYGVLPAKDGFEKIGLAGQTLTPAPVKTPLRPTMLEWLRKGGLIASPVK
ncbi:MAG: hypothetical protein GX937_15645 [Lentisphaerae bacterium]|jgi:hypothetical protein|nr:hypothetical protein [Lentisphaerota bacterium]